MRSRRWAGTRWRCGAAPFAARRRGRPGARDRRRWLQSASSKGPDPTRALFSPPSYQLPRGYADGPSDALENLIRVAGAVDHLHRHALLAVVVEHRFGQLVVLPHPLLDRLPRVVRTALLRGALQDPLDQLLFGDLQGD